MNLNRQEQVTIVEEHSKELFRGDTGLFLFFAVSFLEFSEVIPVFCKIENAFPIGGQMLFTTSNTSVVKA